MGLRSKARNLLAESAAHLRHDGVFGLNWPVWMIYNELFVRGLDRRRFGFQGPNIYESDWDLLIILDACRPDLFAGLDTPGFIDDARGIETRLSIAPDSSRFLAWTFTEAYSEAIGETAYVCANPHTEIDLPTRAFGLLDEVWKYAWDDEVGTVPARPVTDRAIEAGRKTDFDRTIVHYMQPHFPSIPGPRFDSDIDNDELGDGWSASVWTKLLRGEVDPDLVWASYRNNLAYVLEEVQLLAENFAADTAILTADHGNAMGERSFYGHDDYPVGSTWEVPWIELETTDAGTHHPASYESAAVSSDVEDRLASLGYV